jgi:uncharacterized membrane protein
MSDPNEPPRPDDVPGESAPTPPPSSEAPPPPPPSGDQSGYGAPPPPAGDSPYGGAASGGYGGYGEPPAPPYGGPAGAGPAGSGPYSPTDAISFGWRKFTASPATLLVPMIVAWVGLIVVAVIVEFALFKTLLGTHDCTQTLFGQRVQTQCGPGFFTRLLVTGLASALILLVFQLLAAGLYRGALRVADGYSFSLGELFEGWDKTQVAIAAVLIAVATGIGTLLCYVPGLIVGFLTQFTLLFIVDRQMQAVDAIKASVKLVTDNLGNTILFYLLALVVALVGACLCGVGLLVAYPVVLVGYAYTYRRLQGQPVAPV